MISALRISGVFEVVGAFLGCEGSEEFTDCCAAAEIVHDDNVARLQGRDEDLLHIGPEALAIDRTVEKPGCGNSVVAQGGDKGRRLPATVRDLGLEPGAAKRPPTQRRHVGLGPGLVDEDQALGLNAALILYPLLSPARDV